MAIPVKLQAFEGPLDLLLHLIEKNKVDIYDIPISLITEQYLEYIKAMKNQDMDVTSEFLVMAATLLVPMIISSYGLPADPAAALFGAGAGSLVYIFFTKRKSPVFLGSSFTFLGCYAASVGAGYGYWALSSV